MNEEPFGALLKIKVIKNKVIKKGKNDEEGDMEDSDTIDCINSDGSPDCPRHYELHGPRPTRNLNRNLLISPRPQSPNEVADFSFSSNVKHKKPGLQIAGRALILF